MGPDLLEAWVNEGLNRGSEKALRTLFAPGFRDYDPLAIPGLVTPARRDWGTLADGLALASVLASPIVDIHFHIEDVVSNDTRIAYSLFGEGMLRVLNSPDSITVAGKVMGDPYRFGAETSTHKLQREIQNILPAGTRLGGNLHLQVRRIGIFKLTQNKFVEHRGPWVIS